MADSLAGPKRGYNKPDMKPANAVKTNKATIKALTIRQPWAELILRGRKPFELRTWRTKYRGPLVIHAAAKVDAWDARHFGLNPEKLTTSAFVGFAILSDVRPYRRADARLLKKRRAGYGFFPPQPIMGPKEAASHFAHKSQGTTESV